MSRAGLVPPWSVPPGLIVPSPRAPHANAPADDSPDEDPVREAHDGNPGHQALTNQDPAHRAPAGQWPPDEAPAGRTGEAPAAEDDAWPGITAPAGWFLRPQEAPPSSTSLTSTAAASGSVPAGTSAASVGSSAAPALDPPAGPAATATAADVWRTGSVPSPHREADGSWSSPVTSAIPGAARAVGPTKALGGRPGGPGFPPGRTGGPTRRPGGQSVSVAEIAAPMERGRDSVGAAARREHPADAPGAAPGRRAARLPAARRCRQAPRLACSPSTSPAAPSGQIGCRPTTRMACGLGPYRFLSARPYSPRRSPTLTTEPARTPGPARTHQPTPGPALAYQPWHPARPGHPAPPGHVDRAGHVDQQARMTTPSRTPGLARTSGPTRTTGPDHATAGPPQATAGLMCGRPSGRVLPVCSGPARRAAGRPRATLFSSNARCAPPGDRAPERA